MKRLALVGGALLAAGTFLTAFGVIWRSVIYSNAEKCGSSGVPIPCILYDPSQPLPLIAFGLVLVVIGLVFIAYSSLASRPYLQAVNREESSDA